jgi:hypothetical protein
MLLPLRRPLILLLHDEIGFNPDIVISEMGRFRVCKSRPLHALMRSNRQHPLHGAHRVGRCGRIAARR